MVKAMKRGKGWTPDVYDFVDSTHFIDANFDDIMKNLKPSAIPTIFQNVQKISQLRSLKCWPVYKCEIFLDYTSTLQKKATHLCLDMSAVLSLWPFSSMTDTILSSFFLWKLFNHRSSEGYLKSIAY
ncbi:uncharacterized protein LOC129922529 [Biomphalaria glabrata]|uniref:Uncharacterized protein LOC129922529 n=1 Tax=Biomphalaria glabrata TaxID=6526 RepID=A0A9W2YQP8_BIOGL|nr:uncharacterized protein LOC129922529 [Biomphalaria glabrata]XP_055865065.1 uncharacterized protein LOC129922529 [Biomphalaria glabrata]